MSAPDWARHPRSIYWRLLGYSRPYWRMFALALVAMGIFAATDTTLVWLMKPLLNGSFIHKDPFVIRWTPVAILLLFFTRGLASFFSSYGMSWVGRHVIKNMRAELFRHILRLPTAFYDRSTAGELISMLTYNVEQVAQSSTSAVTTIVRSGLTVVGLLGVMLVISPRLAVFAFVVGPLMAWLIRLISRRFRRYSRRLQDSMGHVTHSGEEVIIGHRVVKAFNGEAHEVDQFNRVNQRNCYLNMKLATTRAGSVPIVQFISAWAVAGILYMATSPAMLNQLTAGDFVAFMGALLGLLNPIKQLTTVNAQLQKGIAAAGSIFDLLAEPTENTGGDRRIRRARGDIQVANVRFSYPHIQRDVLRDVSFRVAAGETVAFVGQSGSGKSTLLSLLPRFYDPGAGRIMLDGYDLSDYRLQDLREQIAFVDQSVVLFNDTIANNIAYGTLSQVDQPRLVEAAKLAYAWDFIQAMPDGLDTTIGHNGVMLSGGQRQRLAIARALLKDSPILILDEATSSLDNESERYIQQALDKLMATRTTLVIAHRLSTVQNADRIVVLQNGRVTEQGRHADLLAREGHYASLYQMQFSDAAA